MKSKSSVLPPAQEFIRLAQDTHFPADAARLREVARKLDFPLAVIDFLEQLPPDEVFKNKTEFTTFYEELEMLIEQQKLMPKEELRSPQD